MSKWKKEEDNTERENNTLDTLGKLGKEETCERYKAK